MSPVDPKVPVPKPASPVSSSAALAHHADPQVAAHLYRVLQELRGNLRA